MPFVRFYNENDELIKTPKGGEYWDVMRIPGMDESVVLWVNKEPISHVVDDIITECDGDRVTYSVALSSLRSLKEVIDATETTQ